MAKQKALGKGLSALLSGADGSSSLEKIYLIPIADIMPDPEQPRRDMDKDSISSLADSIKAHGILQPLLLKAGEGEGGKKYRLVAGERRWRAAQMAGLDAVPSRLINASEPSLREMALIENVQRQDLSPIEIASALQALIRKYGLTQEDCASKLGWSRSLVANRLRLLNLPEAIKEMLADGRLSEGHARALLSLDSQEAMLELGELASGGGLTVRQLEEAVKVFSKQTEDKKSDKRKKSFTVELPGHFRDYVKMGVKIRATRKGDTARIILDNLRGVNDDSLIKAIEECLVQLFNEDV